MKERNHKRLYVLVIAFLFIEILLFYFFTQYFS
jgi:hypothetical protein